MRRVALAGVLVQEPRLLILDEPTVGLDGPGKGEVLREVRELRRSGKTVVIISHAVDDLVGLVDRFIVLEGGRILASGPPAEIFPILLRTGKLPFLVPSIFQLCQDLRAKGWNIPDGILQTDEAVTALDQFLKNPSTRRSEAS